MVYDSSKVYDFYEELTVSVQALETKKTLSKIKEHVRDTFYRILGIRPELIIIYN